MIGKLAYAYQKVRRTRARMKLSHLAADAAQATDPTPYQSSVRVAAIVQHFNKRDHVVPIFTALRASGIPEIIYLDDGSKDGSIDLLLNQAVGRNHFIIRSNDLFEVRTYDRAIDFSRGEIVILLQDDDLPPGDPDWVEAALRHFDADPQLAILGGRDGLRLRLDSGRPGGIGYTHAEPASEAHGLRYTDVVNRAPMFIRKSAFRALGGNDQIFAPFQCDDVDLCLRAWLAGYRVGLMPCDFVRDVGVGGMRVFNADKVPAQALKNWTIIADRYATMIGDGVFTRQVDQLNDALTASTRRSVSHSLQAG